MYKKKVASKSNTDPKDEDYEQFRSFPLFVLLTCGILIMIVGVWLVVSNTLASGTTFPGRYGQGGGQQVVLNGSFKIAIGVIICIFPLFQLIKKAFKK